MDQVVSRTIAVIRIEATSRTNFNLFVLNPVIRSFEVEIFDSKQIITTIVVDQRVILLVVKVFSAIEYLDYIITRITEGFQIIKEVKTSFHISIVDQE